jgi:DNA-binding transcriptional MerR regulator
MGRRKRMTIDELAHDVGVSSRNIRYYQTRGLLPPPKVEGRTGYYERSHVERLKLIQELQAEGLNLQAIGWLLGGSAGVSSEEVRRLKRAVLDGWASQKPFEVDAEALARGLDVPGLDTQPDPDDDLVKRAADLGLIEPTEDPERWRVLLPGALAAGTELRELGAGLGRLLDVLEVMRDSATRVAEEFVAVFDEAVLEPWDTRGRPDDEWPDIREAVERMRPLAGEAVIAVFGQVMAEAVANKVQDSGPEDVEDVDRRDADRRNA